MGLPIRNGPAASRKLGMRFIEDDPIESEFIQSWDKVQQIYKSDYDSHLKFIVLRFLAALRRAGYGRKLRAGQSMHSLLLSPRRQRFASTGRMRRRDPILVALGNLT